MTFQGSATNGTVRTEMWYLKAPPSGVHNVVVVSPNASDVTATSTSFTGVSQTTSLGTAVTGLGTGTAPSLTVSSAIGEPVVDIMGATGSTTPTAGTSQIARQTNNTSTGFNSVVLGSSTQAGSASLTMSWTIASGDWAHVAAAVKASSSLTAVFIDSFTVDWQTNATLLKWRAGYDAQSYGFYVYREDQNGDRILLNDDIILSGALAGAGTDYSWSDSKPGFGDPGTFWLKDVKLDGSYAWYGPAQALASSTANESTGADASKADGTPDLSAPTILPAGPSTTPKAAGCNFIARTPVGGLIELALLLGWMAICRRFLSRRGKWGTSAVLAFGILGTNLWMSHSAEATGGVGYDTSATGTGVSGLTFAHTMSGAANGLLVVGVVTPVNCATTSTDGGNCGSCGSTCPLVVPSSLGSGLLGLWHLDDGSGTSFADSSGNANTGTLLTSSGWVSGYSNDGLELDGSTNYLNAPIGNWFGFNQTLSVTAWVYATASSNGPIFGVTAAPPSGGWDMPFLSINGSTVYGHLWMVNGNMPLSAAVSLNAWHLLALTYDPAGSGSEKFYVDGAVPITATGTFLPSGLADYLTTYLSGYTPPGVNPMLKGTIDELRAYNRVLTAGEVSGLYTARTTCAAGVCSCPGATPTNCSGTCSDTTSDAFNCGSCGHVCNSGGGETCMTSSCGCVTGTDCSTVCINTTTDASNCGGCATPCSMNISTGFNNGAVGVWHFDEGSGSISADASGSGDTATLFSSPSWTTGYAGKALSFSGTSYVQASLTSAFGNNQTLSASAWVYATATTNGPIFGVTSIPSGGGWNMPFLSIAGSTVYGHLWMVNGNVPLSATVTLNAWHHLAITYDPAGSGTETFYVDGAVSGLPVAGQFQASGFVDYFSTYIGGTKPTGVNSYLTGTIDDVRAYTRVLSASEISVLANSRLLCSSSMCTGCSGSLTSCSGTCTNTNIDGGNCGSCGHSCNTAGGETCAAATCGCTTGTDCSGSCKDLTSDSANCNGCGLACPALICGSCDSGMVGLYHMSEGSGVTTADSSGSGHDATLAGGPTWTAGYSGDGLQFNGSNSLQANIGTWFGTDSTMSAAVWVYATSSTNGPLVGISAVPGGGSWNMPFLSIAGSTVYGHLWMVNGNNPLSAMVSLNAWHHLAITYDPASGGTEKFYVDGVMSNMATGDYQGSTAIDYFTTHIGGYRPGSVNTDLTGLMDEVRLYQRVISAGEVALLYSTSERCVSSSCSSACPAGTTICSGACTNTDADFNNCSSCGHACTVGQTCVAGACM